MSARVVNILAIRREYVQNRNQGSSSSGNVVQIDDYENEADILCVSSSKCIDVWILDSGYSYHITLHQ